jgi:hypothetical protein
MMIVNYFSLFVPVLTSFLSSLLKSLDHYTGTCTAVLVPGTYIFLGVVRRGAFFVVWTPIISSSSRTRDLEFTTLFIIKLFKVGNFEKNLT